MLLSVPLMTLSFYMGAKYLNSGPHSCISSALISSPTTSPVQSAKVLKSFSQLVDPTIQECLGPAGSAFSSGVIHGFTKCWHYWQIDLGESHGECSLEGCLTPVSDLLLPGHGRWEASSIYSHHHNALPYHGLGTTKPAPLRMRLLKLWARISLSFCKAVCLGICHGLIGTASHLGLL